MPLDDAKMMREFCNGSRTGECVFTSSIDFKAMGAATDDAPYDLTKDLRFQLVNANNFADIGPMARMLAAAFVKQEHYEVRYCDDDTDWPTELKTMAVVLSEVICWAAVGDHSVELPSLTSLAAVFNSCREATIKTRSRYNDHVDPMSEFVPDLEKLTPTAFKKVFLNLLSLRGSMEHRRGYGPMLGLRQEKWPLFAGCVCFKAIASIIEECAVGFSLEFSTADPEGGGRCRGEFEISGLQGLSKMLQCLNYKEIADTLTVAALGVEEE